MAEEPSERVIDELRERGVSRRTARVLAAAERQEAPPQDLRKDQLYAMAREADIPGRSSMTKQELLDALRSAGRL